MDLFDQGQCVKVTTNNAQRLWDVIEHLTVNQLGEYAANEFNDVVLVYIDLVSHQDIVSFRSWLI